MNNNFCIVERFSKLSIGFFFLILSAALVLSGFTVLPVFGIFVALPFLLVSLYFFRAHLNKDCQLE